MNFLPDKKVIFVDQVANIISKLKQKLVGLDFTSSQFKIILNSATEIDYTLSGNSNCFIIVGVGADLVMQILERIPKHKDNSYILCAHQYSYKLRQYLIDNNYKMQKEILLNEQDKFYEILKISGDKGKPISLIGEELWSGSDPISCAYLDKQIAFFSLKAKHDEYFTPIIKAYLAQAQKIYL